jgi:hypothetical protein
MPPASPIPPNIDREAHVSKRRFVPQGVVATVGGSPRLTPGSLISPPSGFYVTDRKYWLNTFATRQRDAAKLYDTWPLAHTNDKQFF